MVEIFSRILVPHDGSKFSKHALDIATEVAKKEKSKIDIISVINADYVNPPGGLLGIVSPSSINAIEKIMASSKKETSKMLESEASKCRNKGIKTDCKVLTGNTTYEILKFAKQKKTTLIVIGSQGLHGIHKLKILGSTSRKVSEAANCPVLIVR